MEQQTQFTEGKILGPLLKFAVPVLFAMFLQAMYGAVDLLVVGQFGAAADVSAVATGSQMMHSITSVIIGLAMGTTILMGQKIGQKKSDEAGDVIGVAEKLCGFIMLVPSSFMQSLSAFVAQNIGAGKRKRAVHAMCYGMLASLVIDEVIAYFAFFHGDVLSAVFARDAQVILASADYLKAYAMDTLLVSFLFCFMGFFNGCGKTTFVMAEGIIGAFGVRIPVSYIMSRTADASLFKVGLAIPLSTIVQIILCVGFFIYLNRKNKEKSEDIEE